MPSKKKLVAAVSLLALLGLTACDVQAKPADYNDVIVTINNSASDSKNVYHNISSIVEDAYHEGSLASDVLDTVLYEYAVSIFGRYNKVVKGANSDTSTTLKQAVASAESENKAVANAFINAHKAYWTTNKNGKRVDDLGKEVTGDVTASASEIARLINKWEYIEKLIAEKMYSKISGGTYSDRNMFNEKTFVVSLKNSSKSVDLDGAYSETLLLPSVEPNEVFVKGILNRDHYQSNYALTEEESLNGATYIEDELIKEIYSSLLTEQYLVDKKYNVIGSSYARKINVFSITSKTKFPKQDDYFMDSLINKINALPENSSDLRVPTTLDDFKAYSNAWLGIPDDDTGKIAILDDINTKNSSIFNKVTFKDGEGNDTYYYNGTESGELTRKYLTLNDLNDPENYRKVDSEILNDFTNSGAYDKEIGLEIKSRDLQLKDQTTTGWYISNGGLTELPDAIRTRLFSFSVGTAFKEDAYAQNQADRIQKVEGTWTYKVPENESAYLARINNVYYLKNSSAAQGSDAKNDILFYDTTSSAYYVIQVEEAVRSAKLSKDDTITGSEQYSADKREEVINEVSKCVSSTDSYTSLAKVYWLEQMSIQYHDTVVYDYFTANYPELFE